MLKIDHFYSELFKIVIFNMEYTLLHFILQGQELNLLPMMAQMKITGLHVQNTVMLRTTTGHRLNAEGE